MNLEPYGVEKHPSPQGVPLHQLLNKDTLLPIIKQYGNYLNTSSLPVAGSLFLKRYAVLVAASSLDYYGLQKKRIDWWSTARFDVTSFKLLIEENSTELFEDCWKKRLFAQNLTPMITIISKECRISSKILWENIAVRLLATLRKNEDEYSLNELNELFNELTCAETNWLGMKQNPLQTFLQRKETWSEVTVRKTCCRYYQVNTKADIPYCKNCPLRK
ncbi:IucA/IucC family C-terminal-domain containing protein [Lysinibacillus sp. NPDC056959]|uniref:IucA/IucC family C-terminal-domain containing protein n=1 Tax=Lysinibacillus sp. NPDC056959 TaxID=3345981 RepID=UPI003642359F